MAVNSEEQQAAALVFRTHDLAVRQRTKGSAHLAMMAKLRADAEIGKMLPEAAPPMFAMMIDLLADLDKRSPELDKEITRGARAAGMDEPSLVA